MAATIETSLDWKSIRETLLNVPTARPTPPWVKLPSPPTALLRCMQRAQAPDATASELARILERDAGLTCQILRRVNSASAGVTTPIQNVAQAIARLGIRATVNFLTTEVMTQVMKSSSSKLLNINEFCTSNLERALFARHLARFLGADEELAFSAALIADSLLPVVTNQAFRTYLRFCEMPAHERPRLVDFEKKEFGWTHAWTTAVIFQGWSFPDELVCCVAMHHGGLQLLEHPTLRQTSAAAVAISSLIPDQIHQENNGLTQLQKIPNLVPGFELLDIARLVEAELRELTPTGDVPFSLARRLSKPGVLRRG